MFDVIVFSRSVIKCNNKGGLFDFWGRGSIYLFLRKRFLVYERVKKDYIFMIVKLFIFFFFKSWMVYFFGNFFFGVYLEFGMEL